MGDFTARIIARDHHATYASIRRGAGVAEGHTLLYSFAILALAFLTVVTPFGVALSVSDHDYSIAREYSEGQYSGLSVTRVDVHVVQAANGCDSVFTGNAIFQTQWVQDNSGDWLELGTGHQCSDTWTYHYWGYGLSGYWFALGHSRVISDDRHEFKITRGSDTTWQFRIDGALKDSLSWDRVFPSVTTGLESAAPQGGVNPYDHFHLNYQRFGNTYWQDWNGYDGNSIDNPPMCGFWNNSQSWRTGEANSC